MRLSKLTKYVPILVLLFIGLFLRVWNLGYSDYQGDEIKALFLPEHGQSVSEFLLTQRKGPTQFFITFLLKLADPMYHNRFAMRLPFALAGVISILIFYKLLSLHFNKHVPLFASLFFATNGFLVAFSRIIQYQSFVILFMVLALYFFSLSIKDKKWEFRGLYAGFIFWALSVLSHYDGIFIFPFAGYLLFVWFKDHKKNFKHLVFSFAIFCTMLLAFYIPFALSLTTDTTAYWKGRVVGTGGKISSSSYLFSAYQPIYALEIYTVLGILGCLEVLLEVFLTKLHKNGDHSFDAIRNIGLMLWFLVPFLFTEVAVSIPGTHIYTYLIPVFVFMGLGLDSIRKLLWNVLNQLSLKIVYVVLVSVTFTFLFLQSYSIFVNHNEEYPWEEKHFFVWKMPALDSEHYHLSLFGFPYFRNWNAIGDLINTNADKNMFYSTNEKSTISSFYVDLPKNTENSGYYIYIKNPQSFNEDAPSDKVSYWMEKYKPIFTFLKDGREIASVYNMEPGSFEDLILKGY